MWAAGCWERPSQRLRPSPAGGRTGRCSAGTHVFDGHAAWLRGSVSTPEDLEKLLDRIDRMALRSFVLGFPVSRLIAVDMMEDGEIEER